MTRNSPIDSIIDDLAKSYKAHTLLSEEVNAETPFSFELERIIDECAASALRQIHDLGQALQKTGDAERFVVYDVATSLLIFYGPDAEDFVTILQAAFQGRGLQAMSSVCGRVLLDVQLMLDSSVRHKNGGFDN